MEKPRIIIADTDINYIIPLQLKFAQDFFDQIDLEIITDKEFFDELFKKPQKSEILIVSDDMYNSSLQKHNIANIFLMMEQYEGENTSDLNVIRLYKYTSIKEIFNKIVGKSAGVFNVGNRQNKETQIILVTSAAGGVGKTTVSMGISACLTKNYKRVLYVNASRLQTFQYLLDNQTPITASEIYIKISKQMDDLYAEMKHNIRKELFNYLPPFKAALLSLGIDFGIYEKFILQARASKEYDYIIVDTEETFDEYKARLMEIADKVVIVTNQSVGSAVATNAIVSNINNCSSEKFIFICNKFNKEYYNALNSNDLVIKFTISEYIEDYSNDYQVTISCDRLSDNNGIKKVSFLLV